VRLGRLVAGAERGRPGQEEEDGEESKAAGFVVQVSHLCRPAWASGNRRQAPHSNRAVFCQKFTDSVRKNCSVTGL